MGAPPKAALWYYPWDVNAFDTDPKLFDLLEEYGPLGESVYRRALDIIYSHSYYFQGSEDQLSIMICKKIGGQWVKRAKCREILLYCVDIGLFDHDLVQNGIWTSSGIQKRYLAAIKMLRRKVTDKKFFIQSDDVLNALEKLENVEEMPINAEETTINEETKAYKIKGNKKKVKQNKEEESKYNDLLPLFKDEFKRDLSDDEKKSIRRMVREYSKEEIIQALKRSSMYQKVSFGYITEVLKNNGRKRSDE